MKEESKPRRLPQIDDEVRQPKNETIFVKLAEQDPNMDDELRGWLLGSLHTALKGCSIFGVSVLQVGVHDATHYYYHGDIDDYYYDDYYYGSGKMYGGKMGGGKMNYYYAGYYDDYYYGSGKMYGGKMDYYHGYYYDDHYYGTGKMYGGKMNSGKVGSGKMGGSWKGAYDDCYEGESKYPG
eukprot:scaffold2778_cov168-Amphora_coffeaeformis.AAC.5